MEEDAEQGATPDNPANSTEFLDLIKIFWARLCAETEFNDWPMGAPGPCADMPWRDRLNAAILCNRRFAEWGNRYP